MGLILGIAAGWDGIFAGIDVKCDCVCSAVAINAKRQETMPCVTHEMGFAREAADRVLFMTEVYKRNDSACD